MPKFDLIGIHGAARSGKDTLGSMILERCDSYRYSFASPVYAMARAFGLTDFDFSDAHKERPIPRMGGKSPRYILQTLGTEWGRQLIDEDVWVQAAERAYEAGGRGMVVTDVRFQNEADWVRKHGTLIHIQRAGAPSVSPHISEAGVPVLEGDILIANNGTLNDLENQIEQVLQNVFLRPRKPLPK